MVLLPDLTIGATAIRGGAWRQFFALEIAVATLEMDTLGYGEGRLTRLQQAIKLNSHPATGQQVETICLQMLWAKASQPYGERDKHHVHTVIFGAMAAAPGRSTRAFQRIGEHRLVYLATPLPHAPYCVEHGTSIF